MAKEAVELYQTVLQVVCDSRVPAACQASFSHGKSFFLLFVPAGSKDQTGVVLNTYMLQYVTIHVMYLQSEQHVPY